MPHSSWGEPGLSRTVKVPVPGGGIQLNVRPELEVVFTELVRRLHAARVRAGRSPLTSSGGYHKRKISGTNRWSNHSWGLAADFNAAANPYSYKYRSDFPADETRAIARSLGFRWGGDYLFKKDPMHFEFTGSRAEAAEITRRLLAGPKPAPVSPAKGAPVRPRPVATTTEAIVRDLPNLSRSLGSNGFHVKAAQHLLIAQGHVLDDDGSFGPETERNVIQFQKARGLAGSGRVDLATWQHLLKVA